MIMVPGEIFWRHFWGERGYDLLGWNISGVQVENGTNCPAKRARPGSGLIRNHYPF